MSLATSCPSCGTVFRVQQDQLKTSEGWVRCGQCQEVFNALEGLFDLDRRETSGSSSRQAPPDLARPTAIPDPNDPAWAETRPAMFSGRDRQPLSASPPRVAPALPPVRISTRRQGTWDPTAQDSGLSMAPTQPDTGSWRLLRDPDDPARPLDEPGDSLLMPAPPEPETREDASYPATTLEFRSEAFSGFAGARLDPHPRHPDVDLSLPIGAEPSPAASSEPSAATTALATEPPTEHTAAPAPESAREHAVAPEHEPAPEPAPESASAPSPSPASDPFEKTLDLSEEASPPALSRQGGPEDAAAAIQPQACPSPATAVQVDPEPTLDFIRQANNQARWQRPWVRGALGASALLLGLGLVGQIGVHGRDLVGARWPALSPVLETLCQCRLQPPRQIEALVVDNTTLKRPQDSAGFQLGVTLRNKAAHPIAAPHIELSLTDTRGQVVLRRVLSPQEFRQPDLLQAQADATWLLDFSSTDSRITGYTLAAFYP
ncbi:MAG: hypothetical protein RL654_3248 [Pseudomonadota bacterium]|jgi:predicted Zn finger-like uncharacterized protein